MSKTVLITGCSTGIGEATARYFADKQWNVAATMRRPDENVFGISNRINVYELDVERPDTIRNSINHVLKDFGKIDVIVNNAAFNLTGPFEAANPEQIQKLYDVNVFGLMNVTREILPYFRAEKEGCIINITSLGGVIGMPLSSFYSSSKWAVEGFSESLRFELFDLGIRVKIVEPGGVKSSFADNTQFVRMDNISNYNRILNKRLEEYKKRRDQLNDPDVIARTIFKAANDRNKRLRYISGNDAKMIWFLRSLLPFNTFTNMLRRLGG